MRKTLTLCDNCKEEIPEGFTYFTAQSRILGNRGTVDTFTFCKQCFDKIFN